MNERFLKDLDCKKEDLKSRNSVCEKRFEEVEYQSKKLRKFMEEICNYSNIYGREVSDYHESEYESIQIINKKLYYLEDELKDNIQREKNKINQAEEEFRKNDKYK